MKKTYIQPKLKLIRITQNTALLEGSFGVGIHTTSIVSEPGESDDFY